jgi:hypothetical protein
MFPRATNARYTASASFDWGARAYTIVCYDLDGGGGGIIHTFNVKPKTRDRRAGSGDAFSAKQEKLGLRLSRCARRS